MLETEALGFAESLGSTTATVISVNDSELQVATDGIDSVLSNFIVSDLLISNPF